MTERLEPPDDGTAPPGGIHHDGSEPPSWGSAYPPPQPGPAHYGYGYGWPVHYGPPPKQGQATTSMVLGIIGLVGVPLGLMCLLPAILLLLSPVAWGLGARSVAEIDASGGVLGGRGEANAGKIMGIIGTVVLVLGAAGLIALIVLWTGAVGYWW